MAGIVVITVLGIVIGMVGAWAGCTALLSIISRKD